MANKFLNLDELATEVKAVVLDGISHTMREMTVQEFIDKSKEARETKSAPGDAPETLDAKIALAVDMLHDAFPSITKERLGKLTLPQLNKFLEFALTPPENIEAEVKAAQGNG